MANTPFIWKGAVEPAETGASGNEIKLWKGAVEPAGASATLVGIEYPRDGLPTDEARFHTFITASGVTVTGDLAYDFRAACHALSGAPGLAINYSVMDAFKRYYESL